MEIEECRKLVVDGLKQVAPEDSIMESTFAPLSDGERTGVAFAVTYKADGGPRTLIGTFADYDDGDLSGWAFLRDGGVEGTGITDLGYVGGRAVYNGSPQQVVDKIREIAMSHRAGSGAAP